MFFIYKELEAKEKRSLKISIYIYIIYKINNNNVYIIVSWNEI